MPRVTHFEIHADDPERAVAFYQSTLGWQIVKWDGPVDYWLVTTGPDGEPGINGAIMARSEPGPSTWNTIEVPSVDEAVAKAVDAGGKVVSPKMSIPGIGYQAYCQDTEGNVFGLHQVHPTAS